MENIMENTYINYNDKIQIDSVIIIIALWNRLLEMKGGTGCKVFSNDEKFFANEFDDPYDAAWAASAGGYQWTDAFVYVNSEGHLMSFTWLDDDTCPIDMDMIDISTLIHELQEIENIQAVNNNKDMDNNISPAIREAFSEI